MGIENLTKAGTQTIKQYALYAERLRELRNKIPEMDTAELAGHFAASCSNSNELLSCINALNYFKIELGEILDQFFTLTNDLKETIIERTKKDEGSINSKT